MTDPDDMTLDELRAALAPLLPDEAVFDGWNDAALAAAAAALDVPADRARLAFPGGPVALIDGWFADVDRAMAGGFAAGELAAMRVRARITALVEARLTVLAPHREALRRALAVLAIPTNAGHAARLGWRAADAMWRLAGDDATGAAYYTKRTTLVAVYGATLMAFVADDCDDHAETSAFLRRRIDDVMRFERFKARLRPDTERRFDVTRFLGRLRYPSR